MSKKAFSLVFACLVALILGFVVVCDLCAVNEIKADVEVIVKKGQLDVDRSPGNYNIDMSGEAISDIVQTFTTGAISQVSIAAGIASNGVAYFQNLTTNDTWYINVGITNDSDFFVFLKVKASERWLLRLHPTNLISAQAVGGPVNLRTLVVED